MTLKTHALLLVSASSSPTSSNDAQWLVKVVWAGRENQHQGKGVTGVFGSTQVQREAKKVSAAAD